MKGPSIGFCLCVDLALKRGHANIQGQVVTIDVDDTWKIRFNGKRVEHESIPPLHVYVEYNGFPAGIIGVDGGILAAGEAANERTFIRALKKAGAELPPTEKKPRQKSTQGKLFK